MMEKLTFTLKEISAASGIAEQKLRDRVKRLQEDGKLPKGLSEWDYETARGIILSVRTRSRKADPRKVDALKRRLIDDGLARK